MTLEEEIMNDAAKRLADEIDKDVLFGMLQELGWTRVILPRFISEEHAVTVINWLIANCKSPYERKGSEVIFESQQEAAWFALKWL